MNAHEVGIIEYVSDGAGFSAVWQSSDFQVYEISLDGKEIHLTDKRVPENMNFNGKNFREYPSPNEQSELLTADQWNEIEDMIKSEISQTVKIDVSGKSRGERQDLRRILSVKYDGLNCKTSCSILEISKLKNVSAAIQDPPPVSLYIQFVLYKENLSTSTALAKLIHGRKRTKFWTASNLPRRANTSQLVTAFNWNPQHAVCNLRSNVAIGNFTLAEKPFLPGYCIGNHYTIALRQVVGVVSVIEANLESLKTNGFVNYYDGECFGRSREAPSHLIGKYLIKKSWQKVVGLILEPSAIYPGDLSAEEYSALVKFKTTRDVSQALENVPRGTIRSVECQLLSAMKSKKNNLRRLIDSIPRSRRCTYINAYLRFLWNFIASKRITEFGLEPLIGDLVYAQLPGDGGTGKPQLEMILLDGSNIRNYTITDVLLPLPGTDSAYPLNEVASYYTDILLTDGLSESDLKLAVKDYNIAAEYRPFVSKPYDIVWYFLRYNNPTEKLVWSDMDRMAPKKKPDLAEDGAFLGLVIEFNLRYSMYATMALREIMKTGTLSDFLTPNAPENETSTSSVFKEPDAKKIKLMDLVD